MSHHENEILILSSKMFKTANLLVCKQSELMITAANGQPDCSTESWAYDPDGQRHFVLRFEKIRVQGCNLLDTPADVTPLSKLQEEAQEIVIKNPIRFKCLYCKATFKKAVHCKYHVVRRKHSTKKFWYVQCTARIDEECLPNKGYVPKGQYLPSRYPWCDFQRVNPDHDDSEEDFAMKILQVRCKRIIKICRIPANYPSRSTTLRSDYLENPRK